MKKFIFQAPFQVTLLTLLCIFHIRFGVMPGFTKIVSDFPNYYTASRLMTEDRNPFVLYQDSLFNREVNRLGMRVQAQFSLYPPPTAYLMVPLAGFEPLTAKRIWLFFNLLLFPVNILMLRKITGQGGLLPANLLLLAGFGLCNDLMLGQVYLFGLTLMLGGYLLVKEGRLLTGGISWGIVMALKYLPVVWLPVYFIRGKWKLLAGSLVTFLLVHVFVMSAMGLSLYSYFISNILGPHLEGKIIGETAFSIQFQSFESLLNNLFVKDGLYNPDPFLASASLFYLGKTLFYALPSGLTIRLLVLARQSPQLEEIYLALVTTLILLLEPGSATYHMLWLVFPAALCFRLWMDAGMQATALWLLLVMGLIGFLSVPLNKLSIAYSWPLLLQYNRLWLLCLFELVLLAGMEKFIGKTSGKVMMR